MQGRFFWYDVMTTDTQAAASFYGEVLGWGVQPAGAPGMDYTVFTIEGQGVAGLMPIPDDIKGTPPCWMTYIGVPDVDAAVARLQAEGGTLHKGPIDVPGTIRFAVVSDPQGAGFIIAKGLRDEPMPSFPPRTPGLVGWHELYTTDWEAAFGFYEAVFGFTRGEAIDMGPMGTYQLFATGEEPVGGMMNKPPMIPMAYWGVYFNVEAINAAAERVKAGGGSVIMGPMQVPGGDWIVQCRDPQSAYFSLTSLEP